MKSFVEKLKEEKTTHERRTIAMQTAGTITALLFVVWVSTLGVRLANSTPAAPDTSNAAATLVAVQEATSTSTMLPGYPQY